MKTLLPVFSLRIPTADGVFLAVYSPMGLRELSFPGRKPDRLPEEQTSVPQRIQRWHSLTTQAVERLLAGRPPEAAITAANLLAARNAALRGASRLGSLLRGELASAGGRT